MQPRRVIDALRDKTYVISPISSLDAVTAQYGWHYPWLTDAHIQLPSGLPNSPIRFIKAGGANQEEVVSYIRKLGAEPASAEYLLGFGKQHFELLEKYRYTVAINTSEVPINGEKGFSGNICTDWHDELELRLLNKEKAIGPSWWVPVQTHAEINTEIQPMPESFTGFCNYTRSAIRNQASNSFHTLHTNGVQILIDEKLEIDFFLKYQNQFSTQHKQQYELLKTPNPTSDFDFCADFTVLSLQEVLSTAFALITTDLKEALMGLLSIVRSQSQENINLGYVEDELGVYCVFLECKEQGKEYHIHYSYIPRLYKKWRFILRPINAR